jgi:hypothetical protein
MLQMSFLASMKAISASVRQVPCGIVDLLLLLNWIYEIENVHRNLN